MAFENGRGRLGQLVQQDKDRRATEALRAQRRASSQSGKKDAGKKK